MRLTAFELFPAVLLLLVVSAALGTAVRRRVLAMAAAEDASQFTTLQGAVLGLLGLLIGFSFAMAVGRYDARMNAELEEATAIRAAFARTDTLDARAATSQRSLMQAYGGVRMRLGGAGEDGAAMRQIQEDSDALEAKLWSAGVQAVQADGRGGLGEAYLASLMTVFAAAERRQATLANRIPPAAWGLLLVVGVCSCFLVGLGFRRWNGLLPLVLPFVLAATMALVDDLDSPSSGTIRVRQQSLERLQGWMTQ